MVTGKVTRKKTDLGEPPATAAVGRRERRRQETTEKLFLAAMELFSRKGFAQTKVEEITEAADVGKGTFFNYFPSKEHVLGYFVSKQHGTLQRHLRRARAGKTGSEQVLAGLARDLTRVPGKSPQMARSLILALVGNIEIREYMARQMCAGRKLIAEIVRLGQERGELRDENPPAELARIFQQTLMGTVLLWALDQESSLEKQLSSTMQAFFSSIGTPGKSARPAQQKLTARKVVQGERKTR
jgi:AcrR family transcriptional regulator